MSGLAETLFFFDGAEVEAARSARGLGARVISFSETSARRLSEAGIAFNRSIEALGDDPEMPLYRAAADWTRAFGSRTVDASGETLKDALRYRDTTLWWWAELYLHHNTEAVRRVRFLEVLSRIGERFGSGEVRTHGLTPDETRLAQRYCSSRHVSFRAGPEESESSSAGRSALTAGLLEASKMVATAVKGAGGPDPRLVPEAIVFISHAAFWKTRPSPDGQSEDYEHYLDAVLGESRRRGFPLVTLGVGPQATFRTRSAAQKWRERLRTQRDDRYVHVNRFVTPKLAAAALKAFGQALSVHRRFRGTPSLKAAFSHREVSFAEESAEDLARTLLHQVPWAARSLLEFEAAFRELRPRMVGLYAESSGLGRAVVEAARALRIRTLGLQHGILYPNYFSYERTEDDVRAGTPLPDTTAVYGDDGVRLLEKTFSYPPGRVVATGSPRYDALAAETGSVDRSERRRAFSIAASEKLVVLASRYEGIRETHKASGPVFAALLEAIAAREGIRLIVKPHPAEPADAYDREISTVGLGQRVRVMADQTLNQILPATDLLVTVESLSATEALVAGVPVVVLRHPSNLRDLVARGAAAGVPDGEDPGPAIEALLHDEATRKRWSESREAFLRDVAHGLDGRSLERLMELVSRMAGLV